MASRSFVRFALALALVASLGAVACGPKGSSGIREGRDKSEAAKRLEGTWVLAEFEPKVGFEPMLQGLAEAQIGALRVTFDGEMMMAEGPGIEVERNYEVIQSLFQRVDIAVFGDDGMAYEMVGHYIGDDLQFESRTAPWAGRGRLTRP